MPLQLNTVHSFANGVILRNIQARLIFCQKYRVSNSINVSPLFAAIITVAVFMTGVIFIS